jgi:cardiolipin synthase C
LKLRYASLKNKTKFLLIGGSMLILLVVAGVIKQYFFETNEVSVGKVAAGRVAAYQWHESPHQIRLIHDPFLAFNIRRQLIREATEAIDICTFIWRDDETGLTLLQELSAAAARGVKVRLLGDGIFFMREPAKVAAIAQAHPLLDLRFYNPLDNQVSSLDLSSLESMVFDFSNINQRLHMKILVVDGKEALMGGRNIGNENFGLDRELSFMDRDILVQGEGVGDIGAAFDLFWNDSRTVKAIHLDDVAASTPDVDWLRSPVKVPIPEKRIEKTWRVVDRVAVWYDKPGNIDDEDEYDSRLLADRLAALVGAAEQSILIETPYLILSERTKSLFEELRRKNPDLPIRFLTNSLASTDTWQAYAAFQSQLRIMLGDLRLHLYLKKPDTLKERAGTVTKVSSLHSKTIIVDRRKSGIGSYNWDPRSGDWNAEIMMVIDDKSFAEELVDYMQPLWSPEVSWVVAELQQPVGLEQVDVIGSAITVAISEIVGINIWPLTNTSCFEYTGDRELSPYHPDFHDHYSPVGSFPEVPVTARKRILTNLLEPFGGTVAPAL